ncbi:MAG: undecaprenyl-phosphate galactose phosphotransferase WbaP [Candidatus Kapaibacteriales bacterium]
MDNITLDKLSDIVNSPRAFESEAKEALYPTGNGVKASLLLLASDMSALFLAILLSIGIRTLVLPASSSDVALLPMVLGTLPVFAIAFYLRRLYPGWGMDTVEELKNISYSSTFIFAVMGAITFLGKSQWDYSRFVFVFSWFFSLLFIPFGRSMVRRFFSKKSWWGLDVMIIGAGEAGQKLITTLNKHTNIGLRPVLAIDDDDTKWGYHGNTPVVGGMDSIPQIATSLGIDTAILAMPRVETERQKEIIELYGEYFEHMILLPDLYGVNNMWVAPRDIGGILGLEIQQKLLRKRSAMKKRVIDVTIGSLLFIMASPLFLLISLLIILDSKGGVFFRQERMGKNDKRFSMLKFRTMHIDAEERLEHILNECPELRNEYDVYHKLRKDPRLTRVGRLLRKFSLDELPQFIHVLKGEMSLVGPRAYIPWEKSKMGGNDELILKVKPGLSGLWQVTSRADSSFEERSNTDVYYIRNWSFILDLYILAKTVVVVITGRGAY